MINSELYFRVIQVLFGISFIYLGVDIFRKLSHVTKGGKTFLIIIAVPSIIAGVLMIWEGVF